jgi:hypothetical protein
MKIIKKPVKLQILWEKRDVDFTELMKVVVDIEKRILAIDAEMYSDLEEVLKLMGSKCLPG